jgi:hypothetical protein
MRKDWKKPSWNTSPPSDMVFESSSGKIIWIRKSEAYGGKWLVGGVNKRGYIRDNYFKNKKQALSYAKKYMEKTK